MVTLSVPIWLITLVIGLVVGAGGVLALSFVQYRRTQRELCEIIKREEITDEQNDGSDL